MPQCSAAIHSAQSSSTPIEIRKETPVQQNNIKMQPDILSEFREVPQYFHVHLLNSAGGQQDNIIQQVTTPLPVPLPPQGQWPTPGYSWQGSHTHYNQMVTTQSSLPTPAP